MALRHARLSLVAVAFPSELAWLEEPLPSLATVGVEHLFTRREQMVPVLGAGASVGAGQPGSGELARYLHELRGEGAPALDGDASQDPRAVADRLLADGILDQEALQKEVAKFFRPIRKRTTSLLEALVSVPSRLIFTLNYDLTLESAAQERGITYRSLTLGADLAEVHAVLAARTPRPSHLSICHLHGSVEVPNTIVLDSASHNHLRARSGYDHAFTLLLKNFVVVFMATSLDEQDVLGQLAANTSGDFRHLYVGSADTRHAIQDGRLRLSDERHRVVVRQYPDEDGSHRALDALVRFISSPVPTLRPAHAWAPQRPSAEPGFVPPYLRALSPGRDRASDWLFRRAEPALDVLFSGGGRTVVIGAPGAGKSTLLREFASVSEGRTALLSLPTAQMVGAPQLLLESWLSSAGSTGMHGAADPTRSLERESVHFLLDGLDEVPASRRPLVIRKIVEVARASPMHMFTLSTRPVDLLREFPEDEWAFTELETGPEWQEAFLRGHGLQRRQLTSELPSAHDLRELLEVPFFLASVVHLKREGFLEGATDAASLVERLVVMALSGTAAALEPAAARWWLGRVALAFQLSLRTAATIDELAAIPMPPELAGADAVADIVDTMVAARVFSPAERGRFGFVHRLIGETLAAIALVERDPPEAIDVIAPRLDPLHSGVRREWLVSAFVLALRSERWRIALASRDPLAGAAATPDGAPEEERRAAGWRIWQTFSDRAVWIWSYGTPDLVGADYALARLIRGGGLEDLRDVLHAEARGATREIRGNAIRVLSLLHDGELNPVLRQILEDLGEEPMMRRIAARAAAKMHAVQLLPQIVELAALANDQSEAQDLSIYALDLATDATRQSVAMTLAGGTSGTAHMVLGSTYSRLAPSGRLQFLRAWATTRDRAVDTVQREVGQLAAELPLTATNARSLGLIVAAWDIVDEDVAKRLRGSRAVLDGMVEAVAASAASDFDLLKFASWFSRRDLERVNLPQYIVDAGNASTESG